MDLTAIRTAVRDIFGDVDSAQFTDSQITLYANFAVSEICRRLGFLRAKAVYAAMDGINTEGVGGVVVPTDFLQEIEIRWNGIKLRRIRYDELFAPDDSVQLTTDQPYGYAVTPVDQTAGVRRFIFYPYQGLTQAAVVTVLYLSRAADLVAGADVPKIPADLHMAVVFYASHLLAGAEDNPEKSNFFKAQFQEQVNNWTMYSNDVGYKQNPQVREDGESIFYYDYQTL